MAGFEHSQGQHRTNRAAALSVVKHAVPKATANSGLIAVDSTAIQPRRQGGKAVGLAPSAGTLASSSVETLSFVAVLQRAA